MSDFIQQIKTAYEVSNLTPEQIIESLGGGLEIAAVKAVLMQHSNKYRIACKNEPEDESIYNFSNEQLKDANVIIHETMMVACNPDGSIDFRTRLDAAKYIRNDKKGRLEPAKVMPVNHTNVLMTINQSILQAREKAAKVIS